MRTTIDSAGRLVVPKKMRDRLSLGEGGAVEVVERDGVIEIRPASADVRLVEGPAGPVAHPVEPLPALGEDEVRETLEHLRR